VFYFESKKHMIQVLTQINSHNINCSW